LLVTATHVMYIRMVSIVYSHLDLEIASLNNYRHEHLIVSGCAICPDYIGE